MPTNQHKRQLKYSSGFPWEEADNSLKEELELKQKLANQKKNQSKINGFAEVIYGRPLFWYKEVVLWPMFILLLVELGVRVMQTKYLYLWNEDIFSYTIYVARIILFGYLTISAIKQYQATITQAVFAASLGGLIIGFLLAVFQLFWYFELWTFFNLLGQPLLMVTMGAVISGIVGMIFKKVIK